MVSSSTDYLAAEELADALYDFLPASFNNTTSFPIAATRAGVGDLWQLDGSKRPAISLLIQRVLSQRRKRLPSLVLCVVRQSITWRGRKGNPLTREEVEKVNAIVLKLGYIVKDLVDPVFLAGLPTAQTPPSSSTTAPNRPTLLKLQAELLALVNYPPQQRGYKFEAWLKDLFDCYQLAPRSAFRLAGEQIDGSFEFQGQSYLVEAKWQNAQTSISDLLTFAGKVEGKAVWARGLFVSNSGFTADGLDAFSRGRRTNIVAMDGLDLSDMLARSIPFSDVMSRKVRAATETNRAFVQVRELFSK